MVGAVQIKASLASELPHYPRIQISSGARNSSETRRFQCAGLGGGWGGGEGGSSLERSCVGVDMDELVRT